MANNIYAKFQVTEGQSIAKPDNPVSEGHSFSGWSTSEDGDIISFPFTPTADTTLYAIWDRQTIIGFTGLSNSNGTLTWTDDIADLNSSAAYTTSTSGTVSSDLDSVFPFNEIEEYTDDSGNVFIKFPKMYIQWIEGSNYVDGIRITNVKTDGFFVPDCYLKPDGSGDYNDCFYIGKYEGSGSSSKVYSVTDSDCLVSITRANFRAGCQAYGTSSNYYNGYQQLDMSMYTLYNFLCMLYYKTANIQTVYGGRTGSGSGTWSAAAITGTTDGINGLNGWNTSTDCVKMLGVENPYGNIYKWVDGIFFSTTAIYIHRYPTQFADSTTNGTAMGFTRPSSSAYITYLRAGINTSTRSCVYCSTASGSASTYVGDYCWYSSSGTVLYVGGHWDNGTDAGLWGLYGSNAASHTYSRIGGRLCLRPS